jgi:hypothetical protein
MTVDYARETVVECCWGISDMLEEHADEAMHEDVAERVEVDWSLYKQVEAAGMLYVFTMRDDGEMVGYCSSMVCAAFHNRGETHANVSALYVTKKYRGAKVKCFLDYVEKCLREAGADVVYHYVGRCDYSRLLEHMEYRPEFRLYRKDLRNDVAPRSVSGSADWRSRGVSDHGDVGRDGGSEREQDT